MNKMKFNAFIGLEMAMSIVQLNEIKDYWRTGFFEGHKDFSTVMSRDDFMNLRSNLCLRNPCDGNEDEKYKDPLYGARKVFENFQKHLVQFAVPYGASALDENTVATKAKCRTKTYLPNKPDKYGIRFYSVVSNNVFLSSMSDNWAGNYTGESGPKSYTALFCKLWTPYKKLFEKLKNVDKNSSTALWVLQLAHQRLLDDEGKRDYPCKRVFFMDNYYTRHTFANALAKITDGTSRVCGTIKFTNVDSTNRVYVRKGIAQLKNAPRGCWLLVRAYNPHPNLTDLRNKHNSE